MNYGEACEIVFNEASIDELLEAHKVIAIEHGYRCCELAYNLRDNGNATFENLELVKLLGSIEILKGRIKKEKSQPLQNYVNPSRQ